MKAKQTIATIIIICISTTYSYSQVNSEIHKIAFYNVENLFHPSDDSLTADEEFTPAGLYHWSYKKYHKKISMIAKVIIALGEDDTPWIIGLAEIENELVLKDLCYKSPLRTFNYRYVHYDSPDRRGVDVALLYRADSVRILRQRKIPVVFPFEPEARNRDILHATVGFGSGDSAEVFVNHWTSRYGGYAATVPKRNHYASVLRGCTDSILAANPDAKVIIMGDFNDYATDESIYEILRARKFGEGDTSVRLFNLMLDLEEGEVACSHKHEDFWGCLDQIIVTKSWLTDSCGVRQEGKAGIFSPKFMLVDDEKYGGKKNYRTFLGPRYIGGFADHLPVFVRFRERNGRKG